MNTPIKRAIVTGTLVAGLALGGTGVAVATTGGAATPPSGTDTSEQDPSYVGTIPAPADSATDTETADGPDGAEGPERTEGAEGSGAEGADDSAAEAAESAALAGLATVTADEATAAALQAVPGTAGAAQLENENGYVVYGVEITQADGTTVDVKIDAGNGTVLAQDTGDGDGETAD